MCNFYFFKIKNFMSEFHRLTKTLTLEILQISHKFKSNIYMLKLNEYRSILGTKQ